MKSVFKRFTAMVLVAVMVCGIVGSVPASAASLSYSKNVTIYMYGKKSGQHGYADVEVKNASAKLENVKSSNSKVGIMTTKYSKKKKTATISLQGGSPGTSKVTFNVKGKSKTYTINVTVKKYTSPVKTLKVTGVNSGKNLAGKFSSTYFGDVPNLKKKTSNAQLTVTPKSGWALREVQVSKYDSNKYVVNKKVNTTKKTSYNLGTLKKSSGSWNYWVMLTFKNKKTKGERSIEFTF